MSSDENAAGVILNERISTFVAEHRRSNIRLLLMSGDYPGFSLLLRRLKLAYGNAVEVTLVTMDQENPFDEGLVEEWFDFEKDVLH